VVVVVETVVVVVAPSVVLVVVETTVVVVTAIVVVVVEVVVGSVVVVVVGGEPEQVHSFGRPGATQVPGHAWSPPGAEASHCSPASRAPLPHVNRCVPPSVTSRCATI